MKKTPHVLMGLALAVTLAAAPAARAIDDTQTGDTGATGNPGQNGAVGGDAAASAISNDPTNNATATAGNGGDAGPPLNSITGNGGNGGNASAAANGTTPAATSVTDTATASGGNGGAGSTGGTGGNASAQITRTASGGVTLTLTAVAAGGFGGTSTGATLGGAGGSASLGPVTGTSDSANVTVSGQAAGGFGGSGVTGGAGAAVSLNNTVDGNTSASIQLSQTAQGGSGGTGSTTGGAAGSATSNLALSKSALVLGVNSIATGGDGGSGPTGAAGANASAQASATNNAGESDAVASARGGAGTALLPTSTAGGGNANATAMSVTSGDGHPIFVQAIAQGGLGGHAADNPTATGNAISSATATASGLSVVNVFADAYGGNAMSAGILGGTGSLGNVFGQSNGGSVFVTGTVQGGSGDPVLGGSGAAEIVTDAIDAATSGSITLDQVVTGGNGGYAVDALQLAGSATSSLARSKSSALLSMTTSATGGNGGLRNAPTGSAGDGAPATANTSATNSGGEADAFAHAFGGSGGDATGGALAGNGAPATATATAFTSGDGHPIDILSLAEGGAGFTSSASQNAGRGGNGTASATAQATGNSTISITASANGGNGSRSGLAANSDGGIANAHASGVTLGQATVAANAIGGFSDGLHLPGPAFAEATATAASGNASTMASSPSSDPNGVITSVFAQTYSPVNNSTSLTRSQTSFGQPLAFTTSLAGLQTAAFAEALPPRNDVQAVFSGAAAIANNFNLRNSASSQSNILGILLMSASNSSTNATSETHYISDSLQVNFNNISSTQHIIAGLFDPQVDAAGFDSLRFHVSLGNTTIFDQTFTNPATAYAYFNDQTLDLGPMPKTGTQFISFSFDVTESQPGGFNASILVGNSLLGANPGPSNLTWKGNLSGGLWNTNDVLNWNDTTTGGNPDFFLGGDNVTFDDSSTSSTVAINSTLFPGSVTVNTAGRYLLNGTGSIAGTGGLLKTGPGSLTLAVRPAYSGATTINSGTLILNRPGNPASTLAGLVIGSNTAGNWTGKLDLTANALILNSADTTSKAALISRIANQIASGKNGGAWNGEGITSSAVAANTNTTVALVDNAELGATTFRGESGLNANSIIVTQALLGDADLSGSVDFGDLLKVAQNFGQPGGWARGNMEGPDNGGDSLTIDFGDLLLVAQHFGQTLPLLPDAGSDSESSSPLTAPVPEPASIALLFPSALLLRRRRRHPGK